MTAPKLPTVIYPGGLTPREHAIKQAQEWQRDMLPTFTSYAPPREFTIVSDLLAALLAAHTNRPHKGHTMNLSWLKTVAHFAPIILALTPLAPIAPAVSIAIQEAEAIQGASGADKLAHVVNVATQAATAAQAAGVPVDPRAVEAAAAQTISAVVAVVNAAHPKAA